MQKENNYLIERIVAATNAIKSATEKLEELTDEQFYEQSNQNVSGIIREIEASLEEISNTIQGNNRGRTEPLPPPPPRGPPGPPMPPIPPEPEPELPPDMNNISIHDLSRLVNDKIQQLVKDMGNPRVNPMQKDVIKQSLNNYTYVYGIIQQNISSPLRGNALIQKFVPIFKTKDINLYEFLGIPKGGKKYQNKNKRNTRKIKQKGGFLYGKYKKTASSPRVRSTKNASSPVYSSNSKKNRRNRSRSFTKRNR